MPITDTEWDEGRSTETQETPETSAVGEYDTETKLVVAFLDENAGNAYTKWEIVRGVDFDDSDDPSQIRDTSNSLGEIGQEITDAVGDVVASGIVVDDIDEALDELVDDGTVETKEIETGETTQTYYRLKTSDT